MNLQQLQYILAIEEHRHFARAADACCVTQPTLSAMVMKLEAELEIQIFDRSKQPLLVTTDGEKVIAQARKILAEASLLSNLKQNLVTMPQGELKVGIITTLAPYLLHRILPAFFKAYPKVRLNIQELTTENILKGLERNQLDCGILATPLSNTEEYYTERLFQERLLVFTRYSNLVGNKAYLLPQELDPKKLWLLEEGHCLRSQVLQLCELRKQTDPNAQLIYESGSIESLMNLVDANEGITIVPELATLGKQKELASKFFPFISPEPAREISIISYRKAWKEHLRTLFASVIKEQILPLLLPTEQSVLPAN